MMTKFVFELTLFLAIVLSAYGFIASVGTNKTVAEVVEQVEPGTVPIPAPVVVPPPPPPPPPPPIEEPMPLSEEKIQEQQLDVLEYKVQAIQEKINRIDAKTKE